MQQEIIKIPSEKVKKIKEAVGEYDKLRTDPGGYKIEEIIEHCLNPILPTYWDVFHTRNTNCRREGKLLKRGKDDSLLPSYDIGIFLVGYSSLPIALSLAEIQPCEKIYFLYSKETKGILYEIVDRLQTMLGGSKPSLMDLVDDTVLHHLGKSALTIDDPSDPVATFKRIKEVIDSIDEVDNKRIALDLTGGKKTMLGGGYTAGAIWASRWSQASKELVPFCDMYYIDSKKYDPLRGSPDPGTEFLSRLENPYDVYNVQNNLEAHKLFEKHNYEAAAELWGSVCEKLKRPIDITHGPESYAERYELKNELETVEKNCSMATCYRFWDALDYGEAQRHKNSWAYKNWYTQGQLDVLNILSKVGGRRTLFDLANEARVIHYATDRYQNGIRAQASDKLDDAMVRFTQVIEMLCIYRICQIASTGELIDRITSISLHETWCANKSWRVSSLISFLFNKPSGYDSEYKISDPSKFLQEADYIRVEDIIELIQPRNDFIHFTKRVTRIQAERNTDKLEKLAKKFLKNFSKGYCHGTGLSFDELLKLHEFRQL